MTSHAKNIAIFHYKVGGTDGVSLEIDKWKQVLEGMGHHVHLCAGDLGTLEGTLIREMYHHLPESERLYLNTFVALRDYTPEEYKEEMLRLAGVLYDKLSRFVEEKQIDLLIPNNIWSVAVNPPLAIAMTDLMRRHGLPAIGHHHDFYWERFDGVGLTCKFALELADRYLPPRDTLLQHVVINSLAKRELYEYKGISSRVVPNVFDFDGASWEIDDYNADLRARLGLRPNDIFVLQATRLVPRKGIELAIDFVHALGQPFRRALLQQRGLYNNQPFTADSRIVLVLVGYAQDDLTNVYKNALQVKAEALGVDILFAEELFGGRRVHNDEVKVYALWDAYPHADIITYPSLWEGWGNQLLEAIYARKPLVLFEYPVYQADIKERGLQVISLGGETSGVDERALTTIPQAVIEAAADQAVEVLTDADLRRTWVETNYAIGQRYYSLNALRQHIEGLLRFWM